MKMRSDAIRRFTPVEIASHWLHVVPFFVLFLTGLPLYIEPLNGLATVFGGFALTRLVHRIAALVFFASWIIHPLLDWPGFKRLLDDFAIVRLNEFRGFLSHFALGRPEEPATGKFNVGQKLLMWMTVLGGAAMSGTGFVMWFPDYFPKPFVQLMYPLHDLIMIVMVSLVFGHMYLAAIIYQGSMSAITHGYVSRQFAKFFHPAWYKEVAEGKRAAEQDWHPANGLSALAKPAAPAGSEAQV